MARTEEIACKQGCGKTFTTEAWRVRHELKCKGKPATSGRIASRSADRKPGPNGHAPVVQTPSSDEFTVVRRFIAGEEQMVVVCGSCTEIKTIPIAEAMKLALQQYMGVHEKTHA
jgi:hypothetical protein